MCTSEISNFWKVCSNETNIAYLHMYMESVDKNNLYSLVYLWSTILGYIWFSALCKANSDASEKDMNSHNIYFYMLIWMTISLSVCVCACAKERIEIHSSRSICLCLLLKYLSIQIAKMFLFTAVLSKITILVYFLAVIAYKTFQLLCFTLSFI